MMPQPPKLLFTLTLIILFSPAAFSQTKAEMDASWKTIHTPVLDFRMPASKFEQERSASTAKDIAVFFTGQTDTATFYASAGTTTHFQLNVTRGRVNPATTDSLIQAAFNSTSEMLPEPYFKASHLVNKKKNGVTTFQVRYTSADRVKEEEEEPSNLVTTMGIQVYRDYVVMYSGTGDKLNGVAELEYFTAHLKFRKTP